VRYRHLFLGLLTANAAALLFFYGCDLQSGGTGGPGVFDSGFDTGTDTGPGCTEGDPTCTDAEVSTHCEFDASPVECHPAHLNGLFGATELVLADGGVVVTERGPGEAHYVTISSDDAGTGTDVLLGSSTKGAITGPSTDGTFVYWAATADSQIKRALPDGGSAQSVVSSESNLESTAAFGDNVYWVTQAGSGVKRHLADGGGGSENVTDPPPGGGGSKGRSIVTDGNKFYWLLEDTGVLFAVPVNGGEASQLATGLQNGLAIAVDGSDLYIAVRGTGGGIYRASRDGDGGAATPLVRQNLAYPHVATDKRYVYYTDGLPGGTIWRLRKDAASDGPVDAGGDGGAEPLFPRQTTPEGIRVDDQYIYWVNNSTDGTRGLWRALK